MNKYLACVVIGGRCEVVKTNLEYVCPRGGISEFVLIFSEYNSYSDFIYLVKLKPIS